VNGYHILKENTKKILGDQQCLSEKNHLFDVLRRLKNCRLDLTGSEDKKMNIDLHKAKEMADIIRGVFSQMGIETEKIYLFGSRAKGSAREGSDWDYLVITRNPLTRKEKVAAVDNSQRFIAKKFKEPLDILVRPNDSMSDILSDPWSVSYTAVQEGVSV
jgi:predicted nucleotidyltransferase